MGRPCVAGGANPSLGIMVKAGPGGSNAVVEGGEIITIDWSTGEVIFGSVADAIEPELSGDSHPDGLGLT